VAVGVLASPALVTELEKLVRSYTSVADRQEAPSGSGQLGLLGALRHAPRLTRAAITITRIAFRFIPSMGSS
jgi:hypothetical protein